MPNEMNVQQSEGREIGLDEEVEFVFEDEGTEVEEEKPSSGPDSAAYEALVGRLSAIEEENKSLKESVAVSKGREDIVEALRSALPQSQQASPEVTKTVEDIIEGLNDEFINNPGASIKKVLDAFTQQRVLPVVSALNQELLETKNKLAVQEVSTNPALKIVSERYQKEVEAAQAVMAQRGERQPLLAAMRQVAGDKVLEIAQMLAEEKAEEIVKSKAKPALSSTGIDDSGRSPTVKRIKVTADDRAQAALIGLSVEDYLLAKGT